MKEKNHEIALFRLMVLGPLAARTQLKRGELSCLLHELAGKTYDIPDSKHCRISANTIERWYYDYKRHGFEGLMPKKRSDAGSTRIPQAVQEAIIELKKENGARSLNTLMQMLTNGGLLSEGVVSRASLHRFLKKHNLSKRVLSDTQTIERRSFEAQYAGDIWQGDVLHGPSIIGPSGKRKTYLVSLMDDASRLIVHSAFCWGETALDVEGVLKQALLKRGVPKKIIIDNGAAYRSHSLQMICARLGIQLIYCRAYEPEGKGKLERFHRTFRGQFLSELVLENIKDLSDINARLWSWLEGIYHERPHGGLADNLSPIERWRQDIAQIQSLGNRAKQIDDYFCHRIKRKVKNDGTVSWEGKLFEVPHTLVGQTIYIVVDPHEKKALKVESPEGDFLGGVSELDKACNLHRQRQRPKNVSSGKNKDDKLVCNVKHSAIEQAHKAYQKRYQIDEQAMKNLLDQED